MVSASPPARFEPPAALAFAASDPTGGAGLQADLLTLGALGCHPLSVITALTVQDTRGVEAMLVIDDDWVTRQATHVLADMRVAAFKLGVVGSAANARAIGALLRQHPGAPVVVDPVVASGRGDGLGGDAVLAALRADVFPSATVATPNVLEAAQLGGVQAILDCGCRYVLLTGTHEETPEVVNRLFDASGLVDEQQWPRLPGSYHGSGCTLASALCAFLAHGDDVVQAAQLAQAYAWRSLEQAIAPGAGQFIPWRAPA